MAALWLNALGAVHLFVCSFVCLRLSIGSRTWTFQRTNYLTPKIQDVKIKVKSSRWRISVILDLVCFYLLHFGLQRAAAFVSDTLVIIIIAALAYVCHRMCSKIIAFC